MYERGSSARKELYRTVCDRKQVRPAGRDRVAYHLPSISRLFTNKVPSSN